MADRLMDVDIIQNRWPLKQFNVIYEVRGVGGKARGALYFVKNVVYIFNKFEERVWERERESSRGEEKSKTLLQYDLVYIVIRHSLIQMRNFLCI
jgi:hypothetical protein